ncbi:unnamed protein product [Mycena citricolor]|uniref:non-specific serine/threonine protein kinase n=1 Tax=Mycena citricolor TaxID=2018698 RepID=A0AAD2GVB9_9AGAR|nr:unnamed protein product [Mycena citricolor]
MLGHHTKQVHTYGKRQTRIVNAEERFPRAPPSIFDDLPTQVMVPVVSRMKRRENTIVGTATRTKSKTKPPSPKVIHVSRRSRASPPARKHPQIRRIEAGDDDGPAKRTPSRQPLGVRPANTPRSPQVALPLKLRRSSPKMTPLINKQFAPYMDILVLDDMGNTLSQERRVSRPTVIISSDSEDDPPVQPKPARRLRKLAPLRIESDESDSEDEIPMRIETRVPNPHFDPTTRLKVEVVIPTAVSIASLPAIRPPPRPSLKSSLKSSASQRPRVGSPIIKSRQLTPARRRGLYTPPSPPSPCTSLDEDLSFDLSSLEISVIPGSEQHSASEEVPEYLQPLLAECGQTESGVHEFSAFIRTFPLDTLVRNSDAPSTFRKIGEASYSEVYGIGDVVLKVIPLRDESHRQLRPKAREDTLDVPFSTDVKDVLKEIIVTDAMGQVCDGFVDLLRTYIVKGTYPQILLELWDEYEREKGTESVRPDTFTVSQVYAIIVLPNGGPDLEAFKFSPKTPWRQASSIFWQVAKALAHAEQLVSFEHRDLHLGQILVKDMPVQPSRALQAVNQNRAALTKTAPVTMDSSAAAVQVTLIDLGLSRMDAGDGAGGEMVHWTPFDEEIFAGEGDYQFDIYRFMRDHNSGDWEAFHPLTNSMAQWLHHLVTKLLKGKGLKAPARRKTITPNRTSSTFSERDCHECLLDLEEWLGRSISAVSEVEKGKSKGRKKRTMPSASKVTPPALLEGPMCAGEVVGYGIKKGWINAVA